MEVFALVVIVLVAYVLPAIIARSRDHHNSGAILALNLLLGWTLVGWVAAFVWACTNIHRPAASTDDARFESNGERYCTNCGTLVVKHAGAKYCGRCGTAIVGTS